MANSPCQPLNNQTAPDEQHIAAGPDDQAHVQRATTSTIVPIRSLGKGSYAHVDLISMPLGEGSRKLLVRKMLLNTDNDSTASSTQMAHDLKPSSQHDWSREAAMHRECADCPFVLQLLAAKRCRSGNFLLLLEYAALGSLTDILAAKQQQRQLASPAGSGSAADDAGAAAPDVDAMLPLALTAAHLLDVEQQQQDGDDDAEPVFVTLLPDTLPATMHAPDTAPAAAIATCSVPGCDSGQATDPTAAAGAAAKVAGPATEPTRAATSHSVGLPEEAAKFYAGCILLAVQHLHGKRILHRDIKPCNLLLFPDGYLKLADLGCCCQLPPGISSAQTRTGTAEYMAPEVVGGSTPYSYPVDMWSLGVTIWQMVAGCLPDWAIEQPGQRQQHGQQAGHPPTPECLVFPSHFSKELRCLLSGLLHQNSSARLSVDQVQGNCWFAGFDWQALQDKTLTPPVIG